jgi:hypothetical protein
MGNGIRVATMKANQFPLQPVQSFPQFDANIYAALAGNEPEVAEVQPKRSPYNIPVWLAQSISDRFPTARSAAMKRFGEARARVARCINVKHRNGAHADNGVDAESIEH